MVALGNRVRGTWYVVLGRVHPTYHVPCTTYQTYQRPLHSGMSAPRPTWATPAMLTVVVIWACNFIAMRFVLRELPLLVVGALRFAGAALLLLTILKVAEGSIGAPRRVWGQLILIGVIGNTVYQTLFMIGLERTTVANTAILLATSPLQTALLGAITGIEKAS